MKIFLSKLMLVSILFSSLGANASKDINAECIYVGTDIKISLNINSDKNKISLSGLKGCGIIFANKTKVQGQCSPPTYKSLDFVPEYINETGIGRWSMRVSENPITDADGKVIYFEYFCGKNLLN